MPTLSSFDRDDPELLAKMVPCDRILQQRVSGSNLAEVHDRRDKLPSWIRRVVLWNIIRIEEIVGRRIGRIETEVFQSLLAMSEPVRIEAGPLRFEVGYKLENLLG
ncbi:hypothetical protein PYH37_006336 (plasmid) [Sinorhizobium numidicum]|uniref:Transposase n=1 Tax=Sinorhizobium numidicum TaxID=680248 RepID=A0ABY8D951_9HYPH|nr:hypothetical protein [Sinorhizobium numidicum]WEX79428.1 hypothetical protein PYH37_006336 [Sinorhizobium numidicum]WEX85616.1 hypothetical protein PYH38_006048 [Sinorhizobium numidicum]